MPARKNRRQRPYEEWQASESDESCTNSHNQNIGNFLDAGGAIERGDSKSNDHPNNQASERRSSQGKVRNSSQPKAQATLAPWSTAVCETLQSLEEAQRTINNLQKIYKSHKDDLETMAESSKKIQQLEEDCKQKDVEIEARESTIHTLTKMGHNENARIEEEAAQMEKAKNELRQEKEKQDKRVAVVVAEERLKVKQEFEDRERQHNEQYEMRKQELENDFAQKRDENHRRAMKFEADIERLSATVKERDKKIMEQAEELEKLKRQCDLLNRATDSIRRENVDQKTELEAMKKEFALNPLPIDHLIHSFAKIESQIKSISGKYFYSIEGKDWEKVHSDLAASDPLFISVPIDESEDSRDLCIAHAQRVISMAICENIWKPFSSDFTALQPGSSDVLTKISDEINQSDHGARTAKFWNARTMRALVALPAKPVIFQDSKPTKHPYPVRTESIIQKISTLFSLVGSSQVESLHMDIVNLVNLAVDVWNKGQAGGSGITVSCSLDLKHREEWRSKQFDTKCEEDEENPDLPSTTRSRIFPLFPRVMAPGVEKPINNGTDLPGSWPTDLELIIIHPGEGLPEWSPMVVRGQAEQEEKDNFFETAILNARKQLQNKKRTLVSSRRDSRGSTISATPSEQWKMGGTTRAIEN